METLNQFVNRNKVRFSCDWADENPNMQDMSQGSSHWKCALRVGPRRMTAYFSQGPAISHRPDIEDLLDCLASDASGYENARTFEEWASEYGYDTDSRKAERIYRVVRTQANSLKRLLGDAEYRKLLWECERE